MKISKPLVLLPTYNERDNVRRIVRQLGSLGLDLDILFVDDNSPDGTGRILDEIAVQNSNIHVVHRPRKLGIGSAHRHGIRWAYSRGYALLVTMDSDLTHSPSDIAEFLRAAENCDVTVGSRFLLKESLDEWNLFRKTLTRMAHILTRYMLGMTYDATGAFRVYRLDRIPLRVFEMASSNGYSFFFESLYILCANGFSISQVAIKLPARTYGNSKMSAHEVLRSLKMLMAIYVASLASPGRFGLGERNEACSTATVDWDAYWGKKTGRLRVLYELVASFFRRFVIR